jgi:hypothetical protein
MNSCIQWGGGVGILHPPLRTAYKQLQHKHTVDFILGEGGGGEVRYES